jgi:hypothetical protein
MSNEKNPLSFGNRGRNLLLGIMMLSMILNAGMVWKCMDLSGQKDQVQKLEVLALNHDRDTIISLLGDPEAEFDSQNSVAAGGYKPVLGHGNLASAKRFLLYRSSWSLNTQMIVGLDGNMQVVYISHWAT